MTDLKATPGPWDSVGAYGYVTVNTVRFPVDPDEDRLDGESWLDMRKRTEQERTEAEAERLANMTLQEAAPDLYEALASIENDDGRIPQAIWDMRNAALAKARGESQ